MYCIDTKGHMDLCNISLIFAIFLDLVNEPRFCSDLQRIVVKLFFCKNRKLSEDKLSSSGKTTRVEYTLYVT